MNLTYSNYVKLYIFEYQHEIGELLDLKLPCYAIFKFLPKS